MGWGEGHHLRCLPIPLPPRHVRLSLFLLFLFRFDGFPDFRVLVAGEGGARSTIRYDRAARRDVIYTGAAALFVSPVDVRPFLLSSFPGWRRVTVK